MNKEALKVLAELTLAGAIIDKRATWIAMDADGEWYWYTSKPFILPSFRVWDCVHSNTRSGTVDNGNGTMFLGTEVPDASDYCYYIGEGDENSNG